MMKIVLTLLLINFTCLVRGDVGWSEFGRYRADINAPRRNRVIKQDDIAKGQEQKMIRREKATAWSMEESLEGILDIHRATLELSMYMSISMSMSMSVSVVVPPSSPSPIPTPGPSTSIPIPPNVSPRPTGSPGPPGPPITPAPFSRAPIPTRPPIPSGPPRPTNELGPQSPPPFLIPPVFGTPSKDPSTFPPSSTPQTPPTETPSNELTTETSTSSAPTGVYLPNSDCLRTSDIRLGEASDVTATPISLEIGYIAESNSNSVEGFMTELEDELIATAVFAIFSCNPETSGIFVPITLEIVNGTCVPTINNATECYVMQTRFIIGVEGIIDPDVAAFKAYSAIQADMIDDEYIETVPNLLNVEFVSPLPILVPPGAIENRENNAEESNVSRGVTVSPWTIGASVASVMGGFVSLMVYVRSRRSRQRRQLLLDETTPWVSSVSDSAAVI